jgi:phosphatidylserine/phosphatidylglycerophosphate/cardiolipin synthase-like enzyme
MDKSVRALADQMFERTTGAPLVPGNTVRILKDGKENYPAWLEAIAAATRTILSRVRSFMETRWGSSSPKRSRSGREQGFAFGSSVTGSAR